MGVVELKLKNDLEEDLVICLTRHVARVPSRPRGKGRVQGRRLIATRIQQQ